MKESALAYSERFVIALRRTAASVIMIGGDAMNARISLALAVLSLPAPITLAQTFLITQGSTLYRYSGSSIQTFALPSEVTGLTVVPAGYSAGSLNGGAQPGDVFAVANGNSGNIAYRLNNPLTTPSLTQVGVMGGGGNNSPCFANGKLYGVLLGVNFLEYNTASLAANNTWYTGVFGGSGGLVHDSGNNFLFVEGLTDSLYTYSPGGTASLVGSLAINFENSSMEAYGGLVYAALGRVDTGKLELGTVSTISGIFSPIAVIDNYWGGSLGLTVVPAPASAALLSCSALCVLRRRRPA